jgi:hypothetical protein
MSFIRYSVNEQHDGYKGFTFECWFEQIQRDGSFHVQLHSFNDKFNTEIFDTQI